MTRRHKPGCRPLAKVGRKLYGVCTCATADDVEAGARDRIAAEGCTCDVEITVTEMRTGDWHVQAAHDDWCPRLRAVQAVNN